LKSFERSVEVWKDWIRLKKEFATLDEKLPPVECYQPSARNRVQIQQRETQARGVWTKSASRGQHVGFVVMSVDTF